MYVQYIIIAYGTVLTLNILHKYDTCMSVISKQFNKGQKNVWCITANRRRLFSNPLNDPKKCSEKKIQNIDVSRVDRCPLL